MLKLDINSMLITAVNLFLWFLLIKTFLFKPINNVIRKREEALASRYEEAKRLQDEAKEAKEQAQLEREKAIQKHKEEREKLEERIEENKDTDIVEVSEEGKVLLKDNTALDNADITETKTNPATQPVTYTKTGDISQVEQNTTISISL